MSHLRNISRIASLFNTEFDGKDFDPTISSDKMEGQVNTYILYRLEFYELTDTDFEGWTVELFNKADRNLRGALKSHLNDHGLYIAKASKNETVSDQFFNLLTNADYEWPESEAETYKKSRPHKFMSNKILADQIQQNACHSSDRLDVPTNTSSEILKSNPTSILNDDKGPARASTSRWDVNSAKMTTTFDKNDAKNDNRSDTFQQGATIVKALTDLGKLYSDSDNKFGGERYDVLDTKLKIFKELCQKAGIPQNMYHKAFFTMLKGPEQLVNAVDDVAARSQIIIKPSSTFESKASELRSAVGSYLRCNTDLTTTQYNNGPPYHFNLMTKIWVSTNIGLTDGTKVIDPMKKGTIITVNFVDKPVQKEITPVLIQMVIVAVNSRSVSCVEIPT
ncbi:integrase and RNaseH domain-containing protein, partial [Golovinomyces cichoracearum]